MHLLNHPPLLLIAINISLIMSAYLWCFPCFIRDNLTRLMQLDILLMIAAISIAGALFYGKGINFILLGYSMNWFVFSVLTYFIIETPFVIWYYRRFIK